MTYIRNNIIHYSITIIIIPCFCSILTEKKPDLHLRNNYTNDIQYQLYYTFTWNKKKTNIGDESYSRNKINYLETRNTKIYLTD